MPRKTAGRGRAAGDRRRASMRPRPDAAENVHHLAHVGHHGLASMRPRPDAAENKRLGVEPNPPGTASMRPRPDAAENIGMAATVLYRWWLQ